MGRDAVNLALSCGYIGAGTVEFLVDENLDYYFLEMNTRLQVEHTVTEMITGLDLVQLQIEIAEGKPLQLKQEDLRIHGHSMEIRISAEDPMNQFLPSIGTLTRYRRPVASWIRIDDSFTEGMEIPIHYDPMIGKLIVHGMDRLEAIGRLKSAIEQFEIEGVETTLDFGNFVLDHPDFIHGRFDTGFIDQHYADYLAEINDPDLEEAAAWTALYIYQKKMNQQLAVPSSASQWYQKRKQFH